MAVTRLVRKAKKNRTVSKRRVAAIKRLTATPVIKNVDIEQIKEEFAKNKKAEPTAKKEAPVKETPKAETKEKKEANAPVAKKADKKSESK